MRADRRYLLLQLFSLQGIRVAAIVENSIVPQRQDGIAGCHKFAGLPRDGGYFSTPVVTDTDDALAGDQPATRGFLASVFGLTQKAGYHYRQANNQRGNPEPGPGRPRDRAPERAL